MWPNLYKRKGAIKFVLAVFVISVIPHLLFAQAALEAPWIQQQLLGNDGLPLSGGLLYSCEAGGPCPGAPQATYNSSSGLVANWNPVVADGAGRVSVWLTPGLSYKFAVATSTGAVVYTIDNVVGAITQVPVELTPSGPTNAVQLNGGGNTLFGTGNFVFNPTTQTVGITGIVGQAALQTVSGYIQSFGGFLSTFPGGIWNGYNSPTDGAFLRGYYAAQTTAGTAGGYLEMQPITYNPYNGAACTDSFGNHVQQPLPLNGLASFGPNDALIWVGNSPSMPSGGSCGAPLPIPTNLGINTNAWMFARGGLITDNPQYNAITALFGGAYVKLGYTTDQAIYPKGYASAGSLNTPGAGYGGFGYQGGSIYYYFNGTTGLWNTVDLSMSGGGGTGCVLGATATGQIIFNLSNVCTSSTNLTWNNSTQQMGITSTANSVAAVTVSTGYIAASGGFNTLACALQNCVNIPAGGVLAGLGVQTNQALYVAPFATTSGLNTPPSTYGGLTYAGASVGTGATYWYYNQSTPGWAQVNFATSGSGCTLGATASGQIIFNLSGSCTSNGNLTWNNATGQLGVVTSSNSVAAITVGPGFVGATGGFNSLTCSVGNCIQAPNGGLLAGLGVTTNQALYPFGWGSSTSMNTPPLGYGGFGYSGTGLNYWAWNATTSAWVAVTLGGGGGGSVAGPANAVQYNSNPAGTQSGDGNLTWNASSHILNIAGSVQISGVQSINTSNIFVGSGVNVTGAVQSQASGASIAFQTASSSFSVTGSGAVSAIGAITSTNSVNVTTCTLANCIQNQGGFSSLATGSGVTFQNSNGNFSVNGNGNVNGIVFQATGSGGSFNVLADTAFNSIQSVGGINLRTGGAAVNALTSNGQAVISNLNSFVGTAVNLASGGTYGINGTTVINSSGQFVGNGISMPSFGITAAGFNPNGFTGATVTIVFPAPGFTVGATTFHTMTFKGGVLVGVS